ncbi:hypothetical protein ACFL6U_06850, partial [Planctomycetota bacterium]
MKQNTVCMTFCLLLGAFASAESVAAITIQGNCRSAQVQFAIGDLNKVCAEIEPVVDALRVTFSQDDTLSKQAYRITVDAPTKFTVAGGDSVGLMYGGLRLAESIRLGKGIE